MGEMIRNEGHKYAFHIRLPEGGSTSDTSYKVKSIYFPANGRTFNLSHNKQFNTYRIEWDNGKLPPELDQIFTAIDIAGQALAAYFGKLDYEKANQNE
jgi:hypothetical protein